MSESAANSSGCKVRAKLHQPWKLFESLSEKHAVIVLNTPIDHSDDVCPFILDIWNTAKVRVTVDGGTDRWLQWIDKLKVNPSTISPPDFVTGDMDSILDSTLQHFSSDTNKCQVVYTKNQDRTDFTKALLELSNYIREQSIQLDNILVLTDMSGRFDQLMATIHTLFLAKNILPNVNIFLFSPINLTWLLEPFVEHSIIIPKILRDERKCCGLIPIQGACTLTTTGLKWNLKNQVVEFGKLVSTSNTYNGDQEVVTVNIPSDNALIWTMEIDTYLAEQSIKYKSTS